MKLFFVYSVVYTAKFVFSVCTCINSSMVLDMGGGIYIYAQQNNNHEEPRKELNVKGSDNKYRQNRQDSHSIASHKSKSKNYRDKN